MAVKNISDVSVHLSITSLPNTGEAKIGIIARNAINGNMSCVKTYSSPDEVDNDRFSDNSLKDQIKAAFDTDGFKGKVVVMATGGAPVNSATVNVEPTATGANISNDMIDGFVYLLMQHKSDGFNYVVVSPELFESNSNLNAIADYAYQTQAFALIGQSSDMHALLNFADYSSANHKRTSNKLNPCYPIFENEGRYPAIQVACYASQYNFDFGGIDLMKIGGLSEFKPDDSLTMEDIKTLQAAKCSAVVDKAGMNMMLSGNSLGDNYLDNFVNTKLAKEEIQNSLQRALNGMKTRNYSQETIDYLYTVAKSALDRLVDQNIIENGATIDKIDMSSVSNDDIEARVYKGFNIHAQISGSVEKLSLPINLME